MVLGCATLSAGDIDFTNVAMASLGQAEKHWLPCGNNGLGTFESRTCQSRGRTARTVTVLCRSLILPQLPSCCSLGFRMQVLMRRCEDARMEDAGIYLGTVVRAVKFWRIYQAEANDFGEAHLCPLIWFPT
jgi:hypothetical protein